MPKHLRLRRFHYVFPLSSAQAVTEFGRVLSPATVPPTVQGELYICTHRHTCFTNEFYTVLKKSVGV